MAKAVSPTNSNNTVMDGDHDATKIMNKVTDKMIREKVISKAQAFHEFICDTTSEEDCERIVQEMANNPKKMDAFIRACYAIGFKCQETGDKKGGELAEHCTQVMIGASIYIHTVRLGNDLKLKN